MPALPKEIKKSNIVWRLTIFFIIIGIGTCKEMTCNSNIDSKPEMKIRITSKDDTLPVNSRIWLSSVDLMHWIDLASEPNNVAENYFSSLIEKNKLLFLKRIFLLL